MRLPGPKPFNLPTPTQEELNILRAMINERYAALQNEAKNCHLQEPTRKVGMKTEACKGKGRGKGKRPPKRGKAA